MAFYINCSEYRGYGDEVFEGELTTNSFGLPSIRVLSPGFAARWPSVSPTYMSETDGPARKVTPDEYERIRLTRIQPFVSPVAQVAGIQAKHLEQLAKDGSDSAIGEALRLRLIEHDHETN